MAWCACSGAAAMAIQVFTLMPLRSTMNFQYRYGLTTAQAFRKLHSDGGALRFYRYVRRARGVCA